MASALDRMYAEATEQFAQLTARSGDFERLAKAGQDPLPMTTEQFEKYFRDDVRNTAALMREAGAQPQDH